MSTVTGGILGRPRGRTGAIVFGAARSRTGKVVTAREFVFPANPQTASQQTQRGYFLRTLTIVKGWGPDLYQVDFNRSVGQLAGFQSLMSILLNSLDGDGYYTPPPDLPLGALHYPNTVTWAAGSLAGQIKVMWTTESGENGTATDKAIAFIHAKSSTAVVQYAKDLTTATRTNGATGITFSSLDPETEYVCGLYFVGAGTAEGLLSKVSWTVKQSKE